MTSYDTTYNRDLARSQRLYDYANIKNDTHQYNMGPTHQGGGMSGGADSDSDGGCAGMGRPFSDVAKGMGYSGGVRRGAEMADTMSPSGQFSVVPGRSKATGSGMSGGKRHHLVKGSAEAKAYMASIRKKKTGGGAGIYGMPELLGLEGKGGTDGFPSGFKDNNPLAMAGGKKHRGKGMSGGSVPLDSQLKGILNDRTMGNGMSGGDFWSDLGDGFMSVVKPVASVIGSVAPFLGGGMSGGSVADELAVSSADIPLQEAFLGGRHPSTVPRDEKLMLMKKALADFAIQRQFQNHLEAKRNRGMSMSGHGLANSDLDALVDTDFTGASRKGKGMSGGALSHEGNMAMADAMGDIFSGMGNPRAVGCGQSGGKRPHLVKGSAEAKAYMASIRNKKGRGMSGGGIMEPAVSAEVGQPHYSYGQMADTAGKSNVGSGGAKPRKGGAHQLLLKPQMYGSSMSGMGMSGGDFWSDLGSVATSLAPLLLL
jgi:hypothetical protein